MPALKLDDRALIEVRGPDAESLLQGVLTPDLGTLAADEARAGALLTPQGKILFDFVISHTDDGFRLETDRSIAGDFVKRLTLYKLRAKAEITPDTEAAVAVFWNEAPAGALKDSRFGGDVAVYRSYAPDLAATDGSREDYDGLGISAGVAESGRDFAVSDAFPHDVLFDLNGGVSFKKGCFVGQEVVSRMQHRGTARRRLAIAEAANPLPAPGTAVEAGERPVGALGTVVGNRALALVRTDRIADALASGQPVTAGGVAVTLSFPAWTGLSFERPAETAGR
ncbi:MAG TPA: folate-binding protein YgfZ [Pararhizobium sp.]|nr:folate-binding protein YgfZ [Pararhizobium sp.]